ncbi:MAG: response regulator [Magnetococcus sp. MYC-9]
MEDDVALAELVRRRLGRHGGVVETAADGLAGMERLQQSRYDVVVLDYQMPHLDGLEVLKRMMQDPEHPAVIMVSAFSSLQIAIDALRMGAADYVIKETGGNYLELLVGAVARILEKRRLVHEKERAEATLREREQQFRSISDSASDAIISMDAQGRCSSWNRGAEATFGYCAEEMLGQPLTVLMPERYRVRHLTELQRVIDGGEMPWTDPLLEVEALRKDGSEFPLELSLSSWEVNGKRFFAAIGRDITARKRLHAELQQAIRSAEKANSEKSRFLAAMSHEIRTPMNAILGMGEMLAEGELPPEQQEYVQIINRAGQGLLALINDILDLSKIEAGQLELEEIPFDPRLMVESLVDILRLRALSQGTLIRTHVGPDLPSRLLGDPQRLQQILLNLLSNAVKFTSGGQVSLTVAPIARHRVRFSVADTGIGIPPERQQTIFQPFVQAETSTSRRFGGTGLGLSICQKLVEKMSGRIWLVSQPGQGSTFHVEVPLQSTPLGEAGCEIADTHSVPGATRSGLSILMADDAVENRFLVQAFLKTTPHQLTTVEGGSQAVELFQSGAFDLVLMDIQMPGMDGYQATQAIRAWESLHRRPPTPILALTANAMREDMEKTREVGCTLHLSKPISKKRLLEALALFIPS